MLKKFFYSAILIVSLISVSQTDVFSGIIDDCDNYEVQHVINGITYIYTYTCDGTLISVREAQ